MTCLDLKIKEFESGVKDFGFQMMEFNAKIEEFGTDMTDFCFKMNECRSEQSKLAPEYKNPNQKA
jgi:hypothetical protein